jgi:hypothetical protein
MKSTRASRTLLVGAAGLAGLGVGATLGPSAASAATSTTQAVTDRATALKSALAGLVTDGTLTQQQADEVATTLDRTLPRGGFGHGGHRGADLDAAAAAIGVPPEELRTALANGETLAQVAQGEGVSQATLVDRLVTAEEARLAAAVEAGRLTQSQADRMSADLTARTTREVTSTRPADGRGHHGDGRRGGAPAPAPGASPSASSTTS